MTNANFSKKDLKALRDMLHHGAGVVISERTKKDPAYVSAVLNGKVEITIDNVCIIEEAKKVIVEKKAELDKAAKKLNKFLSDQKV